MRGWRTVVGAALLAVVQLVPAPPDAGAQVVLDGTEELADDRPEAWAMKYVGSATLMTALDDVEPRPPWSVELGLEAGWLPRLSERERTVGFNGTKTEEINRTPVIARPRLVVGLPGRVSVSVAYIPPVEIDDAEADVVSLALSRPLVSRRGWGLGARLSAQHGTVEGDITCSERDVTTGNFGCLEPSSDELTVRSLGLELLLSFRPATRISPYVGLGAHRFDNEFRVDARYATVIDRTRLTSEDWTYAATAGLDLELGPRSRVAVEAFYTPLDVVRPPATEAENDELFNVRALAAYRLR